MHNLRRHDMFSVTQRDPMLDLLHHLEHRVGRIYNEPFRASEWPVPEAATTAWLPLVDIFEEPDVIRLAAEVPGVRPEDVDLGRGQPADDHGCEGAGGGGEGREGP